LRREFPAEGDRQHPDCGRHRDAIGRRDTDEQCQHDGLSKRQRLCQADDDASEDINDIDDHLDAMKQR
jgi:hypothetical protein